ncbi:MAG: Phosphopantetheine attachment site [Acidobacteriota bacterium]|jgi:acyl carrier protein|nr:Phosphopantetheine attachment site [Acidobacteriota bacterium]
MATNARLVVADPVDLKVRGIFAAVLKIDGANLKESTDLTADLAVDSLDALELALKIQDGFGIELDEKDFALFTSYGEVLACVREVMTGRPTPEEGSLWQ